MQRPYYSRVFELDLRAGHFRFLHQSRFIQPSYPPAGCYSSDLNRFAYIKHLAKCESDFNNCRQLLQFALISDGEF
jgi:hypothetical protein